MDAKTLYLLSLHAEDLLAHTANAGPVSIEAGHIRFAPFDGDPANGGRIAWADVEDFLATLVSVVKAHSDDHPECPAELWHMVARMIFEDHIKLRAQIDEMAGAN